jgi:hypothetical protein
MKSHTFILGMLVAFWIALAVFATMLISGCELVEAVLPDDWPNISEPIHNDTCEVLTEYTQPEFITGRLTFDVEPSVITWMNGSNPTTLDALFSDYLFYQEGKNVAVIVKGTNNSSAWNSKVWCRDGSGAKNYLSFSRQSLSLGGAATYSELKELSTLLKSVYWLNFKNLNLDSLQYDTLISFQVDSFCKAGRERIDLRGIPVAQSRIDQCFEVGWNNVWFD